MARLNLVERRFQAFMRTPLSVRKAMAVIVAATLVSVFAGGLLCILAALMFQSKRSVQG